MNSARKTQTVPFSLIAKVMDDMTYDVAVIRPDGVIEFVNRHCAEAAGCGASDLVSKHISKTCCRLFPWKTEEDFAAFAANGSEWSGEISYAGRDGSLRHGVAQLFPVRAADGSVEVFFYSNVDITSRVEAEESLRRSENRFRSIVQNIN